MNNTIKILAYAYQFQEMFLSKDIFLIPYYICKELGGECKYLYTQNLGKTEIPKLHRGVTIERTKNKNVWNVFLKEILTHAKDIDVLFLTGSSAVHMLATFLYKKINLQGKVVVFGDMEEPQAKELNQNGFHYSGGLAGWIKEKLTDYFFRHVTYLVANTAAYHLMADLCERKHWNDLLHFYPCLDDEKFESYGLKRKPFAEKENVMVCVGRIGCYQKNTEMLLNALRKTDLKDWKIYMLGPITSSFDLKEGGDFQKVIDQFFEECPWYKERLIFTGMVYDQKTVFEYYNRAKVLLMTSRHESWGNVYSEAAALGCYILSTDVGGATLCSNDWKFGYRLKQENIGDLAQAIKEVVEGKVDMNEEMSISYYDLCYSNLVNKKLLPKMGFKPLGTILNLGK
ncbi:MAG: glycosyltransferase [Prevotella sp.]|nr:glycosyltransferase [Prevotella sp.]